MTKLWKPLAVLATVLAGGFWAAPALADKSAPTHSGELRVLDSAELFTPAGIKSAQAVLEAQKFGSPTRVTVETFKAIPESKKADYDLVKDDPNRRAEFFSAWAREEAKSEQVQGIYILIVQSPTHLHVAGSEQMELDRGFGTSKARHVKETLIDGFKASNAKSGDEARKVRDEALLKTTQYISENLRGTAAKDVTHVTNHSARNSGGSGIMSYVCIGIAILLGVWLVIGIIRAFSGGGGGGGPGGGYGGGGGGFFSSMIGGMFGAAAGMWMYDHFFGHGGSSMSAGDYGGSGGDAAGTDDGNFDNGASDGGDWGGSDAGGGDAGGGDWGGGGGDFGGGGGDFGGGDW